MSDVKKLKQFFEIHPPFVTSPQSISILSRIVADNTIDCHCAVQVGTDELKQCVGQNFGELKSKRAKIVKLLACMSRKVKIGNKSIIIDPLLLFQRMTLLKTSDEELRTFLELVLYLLSLFIETRIRKMEKSALYSHKFFEKVKGCWMNAQLLIPAMLWMEATYFIKLCGVKMLSWRIYLTNM